MFCTTFECNLLKVTYQRHCALPPKTEFRYVQRLKRSIVQQVEACEAIPIGINRLRQASKKSVNGILIDRPTLEIPSARHSTKGTQPCPSSETAPPAESRIEFRENTSPTLDAAVPAKRHCPRSPRPWRLALRSSTKFCATARCRSWSISGRNGVARAAWLLRMLRRLRKTLEAAPSC